MALPLIKNMVAMTVSGTPGTGTITLNAAYADATTTYRSFATAYGANAVTDIAIFEDSVGWELARGCTYTHSGTTISRGTLVASSTGSAVSFSSAARVFVVNGASAITRMQSIATSISGLLCGYSATTTAAITAGTCWIEDVEYTQSSDTTLSLSSGNEIGASSLSADKLLFIYAYNNSGTIAYKWDLRSSSGDDPVWDADYQYWKHPSNGASYRLIGVMRTLDTGATLDDCATVAVGLRKRAFRNKLFHQIITVTGTTAGSIAMAGYVPKNGTALICFAGAGDTIGANMAQASFSFNSAATISQMIAKGYVNAASVTVLFGQNTIACKSTETLYAVGGLSTTYARAYYVGMEYEV